ncbi:hypothetical protein ABK040_005848 [Willaertia magna]
MISNKNSIDNNVCPFLPNQPLRLPNYQLQYQSYLVDNTTEVLLPSRYQPVVDANTNSICILGQGGYGIVIAARDLHRNGQLVAIKKIGDVFNLAPYRMLREIKILKHLQGHENIVELIDIFLPGTCLQEMNDLYIVLGMMNGGDLKVLMANKVLQGGISLQEIKDIMCQILSALYYLESAGILHRDLKPSNVLVGVKDNNEVQLKLCDFGLSTREVSEVTNPDSLYVVTRYYRPPEVILQYEVQSTSIDSWSCGCIFAELLYLLPPNPQRRPLFVARKTGANLQGIEEHLNLMVSLLGKPNMEDVRGTSNAIRYFDKLFHHYPPAGLDLRQIFPNAPEEAIDLLKRFLIWNPEKRITFKEAMQHPFLAGNKHSVLIDHLFKIELDNNIVIKKNEILLKYLFYKEVIDWAERHTFENTNNNNNI